MRAPHAPRGPVRGRTFPSRATLRPLAAVSSGDGARVLLLGGGGRVGAATGAALKGFRPDIRFTVAGRDPPAPGGPLAGADFVLVEAGDEAGLTAAARGFDLIVHTAGPFQAGGGGWREGKGGDLLPPAPLAAAIAAGVPYVDVCDDSAFVRVGTG